MFIFFKEYVNPQRQLLNWGKQIFLAVKNPYP